MPGVISDSQDRARRPRRWVFIGLTITSSWGNGHATTYRGLIRELCARGHDVLFLEKDVPWYAENRDLAYPPYGQTRLYQSFAELSERFASRVAAADVVVVGSYVPEGDRIAAWVQGVARGLTAFYDIDTPVTIAALKSNTCTYLRREQVTEFDLYLSFSGGTVLQTLEKDLGAQRALPLYCSCDPGAYYPEQGGRGWDCGYLGTYSADRQPGLETLLLEPARCWPEGRLVVAGPQYPAKISWPANVERMDHVPPDGHRRFYNAQRFTVNVTREEMRRWGYSPSVRLFEAAACGVPIISDYWTGLDELFQIGREILVAETPQEVLAILQDMSEQERLEIGRRGRARILFEHTALHRAATLERYAEEALGAKIPARA